MPNLNIIILLFIDDVIDALIEIGGDGCQRTNLTK
jgi:hypothetical protein